MKKLCILSLGAFLSAAILLTSCNNGVSARPSLSTEKDSLAYSYGANLYESGLSGYLQNLGVIADTNQVKGSYLHKISNEQDPAAKAKLEKEMKSKVDSVKSLNRKNTAEFIRGLQEGLHTTKAENAYVNGLMIGKQISEQMLPRLEEQIYGENTNEKLDKNLIASGIASSMANTRPAMDNTSIYLNAKLDRLQKSREEERKQKAENLKSSQEAKEKAFLEENARKEGVVSLPDGLQYKVLVKGNGRKPKATDRVRVLYTGRLLDGTIFDNAVNPERPAIFGVSQVIKGWTEALQLMPEGSKWEVYIPAELAYGERETPNLPAYSTLIFEVELLGIE